jgi:hypothetical protein
MAKEKLELEEKEIYDVLIRAVNAKYGKNYGHCKFEYRVTRQGYTIEAVTLSKGFFWDEEKINNLGERDIG